MSRAAVASIFLLSALPELLAAQSWIQIDEVTGRVGTNYDGEWVIEGGPTRLSRVREWVEGGLLSTIGSPGAPPLMMLSFFVRPYIGQGWTSPAPAQLDLGEDGLAGNVNVQLLPSHSIGGVFSARRSNQYQPDRFGGYVQSARSGWRLDARDHNPLLPVTASYDDRSEMSTVFSGLSQRTLAIERQVKTLRYQAHNWKTRLLFNQMDVVSVANNRREEFVQRHGVFSNRQRWGKGSLFNNQLLFSQRLKDRESRSTTVISDARLQHTVALSTSLEWQNTWESGDVWTSTRGLKRVRIRYEPRSGPRAFLEWTGRSREFGTFFSRESRISPSLSFQYRFGPGVSVSGNVTTGLTWADQGSESVVWGYALREPHILGPERRFQLDFPFVDPLSVMLQNTKDGTRYEEMFDYRVVEDGPFLVIVVLPGGRIEEGAGVYVDYRYQIAPQFSSRTLDLRGGLTVKLGRLSLMYRRTIRDDLDDLPEGAFPILEDLDQEQVGVQFAASALKVMVSVYAGLERSRSRLFDVKRRVGTVVAQTMITPTVRSVTRGAYTSSKGTDRPFTTMEVETALEWAVSRTVEVEVFGSHFRWDDETRADRHLGIGTAVNVDLDNTRGSLRLDRIRWKTVTDRSENRISLRFERAF